MRLSCNVVAMTGILYGALLMSSCGDENMSPSSVPDAGEASSTGTDGAGGPMIELGTGDTGFQPIAMNQELPLVLGPQGTGRKAGYHIWGGVRTNDLDATQRINLNFTIHRIADGAQLAMSQWDKRLQPSVLGHQFYALQIILSDCCDARGRDLRMAVTARDVAGKVATAVVDVKAGPTCGDVGGREICP